MFSGPGARNNRTYISRQKGRNARKNQGTEKVLGWRSFCGAHCGRSLRRMLAILATVQLAVQPRWRDVMFAHPHWRVLIYISSVLDRLVLRVKLNEAEMAQTELQLERKRMERQIANSPKHSRRRLRAEEKMWQIDLRLPQLDRRVENLRSQLSESKRLSIRPAGD